MRVFMSCVLVCVCVRARKCMYLSRRACVRVRVLLRGPLSRNAVWLTLKKRGMATRLLKWDATRGGRLGADVALSIQCLGLRSALQKDAATAGASVCVCVRIAR